MRLAYLALAQGLCCNDRGPTKRTLKSPNRAQLRIQTRKVLTTPNDFFLTGRPSVCVCVNVGGRTRFLIAVSLFATQELEAIKARVREMEEEAEKLKELQNEVEKQMNLSPPPGELIYFIITHTHTHPYRSDWL